MGYTCCFMPGALLDLPGCFSARLRDPLKQKYDMNKPTYEYNK